MENSGLRQGLLLGMGNPLLDISTTVDEAFLEKYGLKANDATLAEEKHIPMYKELIEKFNVDYLAGGATQNMLRAVQWIVGVPKTTVFMGAVGEDDFSKILTESAESAGVLTRYQIVKEPTGTCAVLITGTNRSLCANLSAANNFAVQHLDCPQNFAFVEGAGFYYISGFFLTVSPESINHVASYAAANNRPFAMNLSAPFIPEFFTDRLAAAFPYVDILFGNESEATAFSKIQNFGTEDIEEIALKTVQLEKKNLARGRMVVFTQGSGPVIVVEGETVKKFPVMVIQEDKIVDTNGAGDAFVGGFMAQYIQGRSVEECVKCGIWSATEVIQQIGCSFPKDKKYVSDSSK